MRNLRVFGLISLFCLLMSVSLWAEAMKPEQFIEKNIQEIINIVVTHKEESTKEIRRKKIKDLFLHCFDLPRLAGMTLGGNEWKSLTDDEKVIFTEKYAEFVLSFYIGKIESYNNNKIELGETELKSNGKRAVVETKVEIEGAVAKISYSMLFEEDWKIYDVEVEGVRLSTTYRAQFQNILKLSQFKGLIEEIDKLIAKQLKA